jgi:small subunit ribosomal protein S16
VYLLKPNVGADINNKMIEKLPICLEIEGDRSMVRLRLRRIGAKKQPSYRVVAADRESPRDGRFLEALGHYNPRTEPATITLKEDRIFHWLSVGAQPSDAVERLFKQIGTDERYARFKDGEDLEKLMEEYAEVAAARNIDPRTRRDDLVGTKNKAKKSDEES